MFNVYSDGVRSFSGTLEHLAEVRPVEGTEGVRRRVAGDRRGEGGEPAHVTLSAIAAYRQTIRRHEREPIVHAEQVMHEPVVTIVPDAPLGEAWEQLRDAGVRQLPVETADGKLLGLLSERDLLARLRVDEDRLVPGDDRLVADVMQREVITAEPITDVRRIARVMAERGMTAMPIVTAQQQLVGIVSRGDLLRAISRDPPLHLWT